jgi:TolA-binding protein
VAGTIALALACVGCATKADLLLQEQKLSGMIEQQSRSLDELRREIEALREQTAPRGSKAPTRAPVTKGPRVPGKEKIAKPEETLPPSAELGMTLSPEGVSTEEPEPSGGGVAARPTPSPSAPAAAGTPPDTPAAPAAAPGDTPVSAAPAPAALDEDWKREVAQDRAVASTTGAPERAQYIKSLDGLEKGDCSKAIPGLKSVSSGSKGSPLSDNAIYWQARCLAARGDEHKAVSRLNEVVARYPKGDKAPAALWEQGQLQLRTGNSSAARAAFARLIRDYPASAEAGRARRKLAEIP